jgi:hypothetical protein
MTDLNHTPLAILFEDAEALVIDKPAGLPLDRPRAGGISLEERVYELRLGFARSPAPVHRLDQDTSGCLLLARHPRALKRYSAAFEARQVGKTYWGVVDGDVERANELLTRNFYIKGLVVHGEKRGREIGYPTANIALAEGSTIPADGVYAGWLTVGDDRWQAAISIGTNPTFPGIRGRQVEAYALDQTGLDLYDQLATLEFGFRLRDTLKFHGLEPLLIQMAKDCEQARNLTAGR